MPAKIKSNRTARRARKNSLRRKNKQAKGRKGANRAKPKAPRIIANSLFAITLQEKPGFEVQQKIEQETYGVGFHKPDDDYVKMYHDLLPCFTNAYRVINGESIRFTPLRDGLLIGRALSALIEAFKLNILPAGFSFNIDREYGDSGDYIFTIYKEMEFPWTWCTFEIKYIIRALKKRPGLLKLYIEFLKLFGKSCGIQYWYDSEIDTTNEMFEEHIQNNLEYDTDDEDEMGEQIGRINEMKELLDSYQSGEIAGWQKEIMNSKLITVGQLRGKLSRYSKKNPIVDFMLKAASFIETPYNTRDFDYNPKDRGGDYYENEALLFPYQSAILWEEHDYYIEYYSEMLDSVAQNSGIMPPIFYQHLKPKTRDIDIERMKSAHAWPRDLHWLWKEYCKAENAYRPKSKKYKLK